MSITALRKRLVSGGLWAVIGRIGMVLLALVTNMLLARLLSPEVLGAYFLAFSLVSIATIVAQAGLNQAVVRLLAESLALDQITKLKRILFLVFKYVLIAASTVSLLLYIGIADLIASKLFHSEMIVNVSGLLSLWVFFLTCHKITVECFRGFHDIRSAAIYGGLLPGFIIAATLLLIWLNQRHITLGDVVVLSTIAALVALFTGMWSLRKKVYVLKTTGSDHATISQHKLIQLAWPLMLTNLTVFILTQADIWIVGIFCSESEVAIYGAASRIALLMLIVTSLLQAFIPPIIVQYYQAGEIQTLQKILQSGAFLNVILVSPMLLVIFLFPEAILSFLFGADYTDGALVLVLLSLGFFFNVATGIRGYVLMMTGHERDELVIAIIGGFTNISFCVIGAVYAGIYGVALGAMTAMVLQCTVELLYVKHRMEIWTWASFKSAYMMFETLQKREN